MNINFGRFPRGIGITAVIVVNSLLIAPSYAGIGGTSLLRSNGIGGTSLVRSDGIGGTSLVRSAAQTVTHGVGGRAVQREECRAGLLDMDYTCE